MADKIGYSTRSEDNVLSESVEGKRSEKRVRDNTVDVPFEQDGQMSDKRDLKYSRSSDSRRIKVQEDRTQNKSNEFVRKISDEGNEVFRRPKRNIPVIQRSLAIVLASLLGVQIVIELRNDSEITGTVEESDASMNVTLNNVRKVCHLFISVSTECITGLATAAGPLSLRCNKYVNPLYLTCLTSFFFV